METVEGPAKDSLSSQQPASVVSDRPSRRSLWIPIALIVVVAGTLLLRNSRLPVSEVLESYVTLRHLPDETQTQTYQVLAVPVAALVVVFFRLTLGLRMLGPFRPILIAVAFQAVGVLVGVGFMITVTAVTLVLRPRLKQGWLPYYGRLAIMLCVVVLLEIVLVMTGGAMDWSWADRTVFFPIVVLTLTTDGFARMLNNEGIAAAVWCATTTLLAALVSKTLTEVTAVRSALIGFPETLLLIIAFIMLISTHFDRKYLAAWNPTTTE
jgi:uncharacterized membrane protein